MDGTGQDGGGEFPGPGIVGLWGYWFAGGKIRGLFEGLDIRDP